MKIFGKVFTSLGVCEFRNVLKKKLYTDKFIVMKPNPAIAKAQ
jgi:hypothetical protein